MYHLLPLWHLLRLQHALSAAFPNKIHFSRSLALEWRYSKRIQSEFKDLSRLSVMLRSIQMTFVTPHGVKSSPHSEMVVQMTVEVGWGMARCRLLDGGRSSVEINGSFSQPNAKPWDRSVCPVASYIIAPYVEVIRTDFRPTYRAKSSIWHPYELLWKRSDQHRDVRLTRRSGILPIRFVKHIMFSKNSPPRAPVCHLTPQSRLWALMFWSDSPFSDLVHLKTSHPLDNCPCQMGHPSWPALVQTEWPVTLLYPMVNGLARSWHFPISIDWPVFAYTHLWLTGQSCIIHHLWLTGQSCVVLISAGLAGLVLYPSLTDWPVWHYTHLWLTGWSCIIPIFDWLAQSCVCTHLQLAGQPWYVTLC